jgi:uncharacterized Zn-binding protein involved in type VI secretion
MPFAARIGDEQTCLQANPNGSPHKGGQILPAGIPNVFIGGKDKPAATIDSPCLCVSPAPNSIKTGSSNVFINQKKAARQGDKTAHNGMITGGCPNVHIGG